MSNHFSADKLKFPGDGRRLDMTDLFVFPAAASPEHHHSLLHRHHGGTTVLIMDSNPTSAPPPIPTPVTGPKVLPRRGLPDQHRHRRRQPRRCRVPVRVLRVRERQADRERLVRHPAPRPARPNPAVKYSLRASRSASTALLGPWRQAEIRLAAGLRQRPVLRRCRARCTAPAWTRARRLRRQQRRRTRSCWRLPDDMLDFPARSSASGLRSEHGTATACSSDWTAAGTRPSTRSSTPTQRRTCSTPASPPTERSQLPGAVVKILENSRPAATHPSRPRQPPCRSCRTSTTTTTSTQPATYPNGRILTDDVYSLRFAWLTNGKVRLGAPAC